MKKKILFTLLSILLPLGIRAQEAHWQCDEHDFQYDKTIYVSLELEDQRITDLSNYDIAAFCGNECRGFVDVKKNEILDTPSGQVAILRVRTNNLSASEIITFKVYDKTEEEEINVANTKITFSDETAVGSGSSPFKLDITIRYTPGDTNDDGEIDLTDASLVFRYYTEFDEDIEAMRDEIAELKKGIDEASDRAAKYEILKVAFSQDGVPHQIIRNIIPYIRDKANGILGAMTGGTMGVDFVMEKTVKGRDGEKATLDIIIEEYGKTALPYTSKSGGEKVKASLAVNLSLAEVKMEASGVQIGFLGVDEPPFLDEDGTQAYVDSMEAIRKRNPRISIIAITHDPAMKARFSQSLTVVKSAEDGSKIIYD